MWIKSTYYPEEKLSFNEWYAYILKLLNSKR